MKSDIIADIVKSGGVGVYPTDTLYGLVASALSRSAVARVYKLRKRSKGKPLIVLIGRVGDLKLFGIRLREKHKKAIKKYWPGPITLILPCESPRFLYLHRGTKSIAFRLPRKKKLRAFLTLAGPLVAPSANPTGRKPASTILSAKRYFGTRVDFYVRAGRMEGKPSRILRLAGGAWERIR